MAKVADSFDFPVGQKVDGRVQATPAAEAADGIADGVKLDQAFGEKYAKGKYHLGEDWNGTGGGDTDIGLPVYAIANGKVTFVGDPKDDDIGGWGNLDVVIVEHELPSGEYGSSVSSLYGHMQDVSVNEGDDVLRGQKIGEVGDFVADEGKKDQFAHLHFEVRDDEDIGVGIGYSSTVKPSGYLDPSSFIANHRDVAVDENGGAEIATTDQEIALRKWYDNVETWFDATDEDNVSYWALFDDGKASRSGWFWVEGRGFQEPGKTFVVSDQELQTKTQFGYARDAGTEKIYFAAWDGTRWSEWADLTVTAGDYILT
jgi:hypothetical protein